MSETSTTRENLTEQDTVMGAFGKIRKWFADLRALAFKDTIGTDDIDSSAVTYDKIASFSVTSAKLATSSVITSKINALAVTTEKLANLAVTAAKLAANAVITEKIANAAVTDEKISSVSAGKVTGLAEVATSGDYNDLINKPYISSGITLDRITVTLNKHIITLQQVFTCDFASYLNAGSAKSVACLGTMSNNPRVDNGTCSGISTIYYSGGRRNIQLRCQYVSSTAIIYRMYISSSETTCPNTQFSGDGTFTITMFKISGLSAIS